MEITYKLQLCPEYIVSQIPRILEKEFSTNLYSQTPTNRAVVSWCIASNELLLEVFACDNFPIDTKCFKTFSKKHI